MKPLGVDFARRFPWRALLMWSVTVLLLVCSGFQAMQIYENRQEKQRLEARLAELQAEAARREALAAGARSNEPPPYLEDALKAVRMAAYDTPKVLRLLEQARVEGVRVTLIDISAAEERARVELEIASMEVLVQYLEVINTGAPAGKGWRLHRAQGPAAGGAGRATIGLAPGDLW